MADITAEDTEEIANDQTMLFRTEKPGQPQSGEGHRVVEKHLKRSEDIRFDEELQDSVGHSGDQAGFGPVDVTDQADKHHGK